MDSEGFTLVKIDTAKKLPKGEKPTWYNYLRLKERDFYKLVNNEHGDTDGRLYWAKDGIIKNSLDLKNLDFYHVNENSCKYLRNDDLCKYPRYPKLIIIYENEIPNENNEKVRLVLTYETGDLARQLPNMIRDANMIRYGRLRRGGKKIRKNRKSKKNRKTNKRRKFSKKLK